MGVRPGTGTYQRDIPLQHPSAQLLWWRQHQCTGWRWHFRGQYCQPGYLRSPIGGWSVFVSMSLKLDLIKGLSLQTPAWKRPLQYALSESRPSHPTIAGFALQIQWSGYASTHGSVQTVAEFSFRKKMRKQTRYRPLFSPFESVAMIPSLRAA